MFLEPAESSSVFSLTSAALGGLIMSRLTSSQHTHQAIALIEVFATMALIILLSLGFEEQIALLTQAGGQLLIDNRGIAIALIAGVAAGVFENKRRAATRAELKPERRQRSH